MRSKISFDKRSSDIEIMDDLQCNGPVVARTLKELDIINALLGGNKISLDAIENIFSYTDYISQNHPLKIADLGCGSGDLLKRIALIARKKNIPVELRGIDANPFIVNYAIENCKDFPEITFACLDVLSEEFLETTYDVINCTLFLHHFNDITLVEFINRLKSNVRNTIIINDIHRHWFSYYSIKWLTYLFSSSAMVKYDAGLSVLRAFRRNEFEKIMNKANVKDFSINWRWAFRYKIIIDCKK